MGNEQHSWPIVHDPFEADNGPIINLNHDSPGHPLTAPVAGRLARNLRRCAEVTELALALREAVLAARWGRVEGRRRLWAEIRERKEAAWRKARG